MFRRHNPANRFTQTSITWEEEPMPARLEVRDELADRKSVV